MFGKLLGRFFVKQELLNCFFLEMLFFIIKPPTSSVFLMYFWGIGYFVLWTARCVENDADRISFCRVDLNQYGMKYMVFCTTMSEEIAMPICSKRPTKRMNCERQGSIAPICNANWRDRSTCVDVCWAAHSAWSPISEYSSIYVNRTRGFVVW